jgi:hypothetical protein
MGAFDGRFFLPLMPNGVAASTTKLAWKNYEPPTHVHEFAGVVDIPPKGFASGVGANKDIAASGDALFTSIASSNPEPIVPLVTLLACQKSAMADGGTIAPGVTAFMSLQNCLDGWGQTVGAPGRFMVGMAEGGTQGAAFGGTPMLHDEMARVHDHDAPFSFTLPNEDTDLAADKDGRDLGRSRTVQVTASTGPAEIELPFVVLQNCTKL